MWPGTHQSVTLSRSAPDPVWEELMAYVCVGSLCVPGLHGLSVHADCFDWLHTRIPHRAAARRALQPAGTRPECGLYRECGLHRDRGELPGLSSFLLAVPVTWLVPVRLCVPQWFLVKQQAYKVSLAGSLFFAGLLVGNIVFGPLADKIGRRPVYLSGEFRATGGLVLISEIWVGSVIDGIMWRGVPRKFSVMMSSGSLTCPGEKQVFHNISSLRQSVWTQNEKINTWKYNNNVADSICVSADSGKIPTDPVTRENVNDWICFLVRVSILNLLLWNF